MMSPTENRLSQSAPEEASSATDHPQSPVVQSEANGEEEERAGQQQVGVAEKAENGSSSDDTGQDGEKFDGKIVYNPDGSAYIIDNGDQSDDDESLPIPKLEGSIVERLGDEGKDDAYPQIANAFYISKSSAYYNSLYGQAYVKLLQEKNVPETPVVHSYRVYTARERNADDESRREDPKLPSTLGDFTTVPVKPILMCFICKLSFGCAQTFGSHCVDRHGLELNEEERGILDSKNSSAIIQNVGKDKDAIVSFLEPFMSKDSLAKSKLSPPISPGAINHLLSAAAAGNLPKVPTSIPLSSAAMSSAAEQLSRSPLSTTSPPVATTISNSLSDPRRSPLERSLAASPHTNSPSPVSLPPPASYPQLPTNANMLQGTTIGACPDHVNGRPTGVECPKCDLILNQSRMSGMGWNISRNSCKTLKCPKCNWHYKYQETLEIHMKEKHPENETTCIYCITGQQHPRLARGETYTCGYKPYRCEVCNYSTTTKGNLSIHMQSDKHLNNMQDLQNGGMVPPTSVSSDAPKLPSSASSPSPRTLPSMSSPSPLASPSKQKPNWRCDVCNYETNVARNLRIHMTSEKHTHNMMSLQQQNAKLMGGLGGFPGMPRPGMDPKQLLGGLGGLFGGLTPPTSTPSEQAAMADLAYNQAVLAQIMSGGQFPGGAPPPLLPPPGSGPSPPDFAALFAGAAAAAAANNNDDSSNSEPPPQPTDNNPKYLFSCCVCRDFGCDALDDLSQHLSVDRSRTRENEVSIVIGGNYLCQLCNYRTNLKANFQLHCKTDKHLQRLSHVNHIKEGGPSNEWKLRYLTTLNPVELRCNACDFSTNSPHKMQVHFGNQQHQVSSLLFSHLKKSEHQISEGSKPSYNCVLCDFAAPGKHLLMVHVRSMKHLQMEQMHQLKKRAEGNIAQTEIGDIFQVSEEAGKDPEPMDTSNDKSVTCPLCQEGFDGQDAMESHAMSVHSVNAEGLQRLQSLINGSHWLNKQNSENNENGSSSRTSPVQGMSGKEDSEEGGGEHHHKSPSPSLKKSDSNFNYSLEKYNDPNRPFKCDVCKESFTQKNILLVHYNSVSHLHRLKKTMQEQQQSKEEGATKRESSSSPQQQQPAEKTPTKKGSALEALVGNMRGVRKDDDDEVKPFKCNICKVAYSQGSTLDIHIRSVLHQTKAAKLQELILTGQIDLSKPLIEQPDPQQLQDQHKKMINDMLSPKSINSTGSTNSQSSPNVNDNRASSPQSSPLANLQSLMGAKNASSPGEPSSSDESTGMMSNLAKSFPFIPGLAGMSPPDKNGADKPSPVLKNLLQQISDMQKKQGEQEESEEKERATPTSESHSRPASQPPSNLADVQEALQKAMIQAQLQQMNPMFMQMSQLQNMNPLLAMNLHPPLIPPALLKASGGAPDLPAALLAQMQQQQQQQGNPMMDPNLLALMAASRQGGNKPDGPPDLKSLSPFPMNMEPNKKANGPSGGPTFPGGPPGPPNFGQSPTMPDPKALLMQQQPIPNVDPGKRARTRITDDQLKILRSNFDINNSPTEDMLNLMAGQTGLPLKVIKHWFRNTLFKERQKNKDSPYNFNNPPSTKLNLEEYEKTGEPKVTPLNPEDQAEYVQESGKIKKEGGDIKIAEGLLKSEPIKTEAEPKQPFEESNANTNKVPKHTESSSENSLTLSQLLSSQLSQLPLPNFPAFPNVATPPSAPLPPTTHAMPDYLTSLANRMSSDQSPRPQSPQSVSSGKRANRTRFTDYQIKVLQEFFENNAYPKDDDLEYLSKLLSLSPRVIVVWFQNARQKARKIYENQPPAAEASSPAAADEESGRFTRTPGCNYQCKKCLLVFQRYYELIRHQKQHCYKEEDAKRSALAQKAAAQAAAQFAGNPNQTTMMSEDSNSSVGGNDRSITSPNICLPTTPDDRVTSELEKQRELSEMSREAVNRMFSGSNQFMNYPPNSAFGLLHHQALQQQLQQRDQDKESADELLDDDSLASSPSSKRKLSEDGDLDEDTAHRDKRLRTTILPEQLDFLYQRYQQESNPSRKQLEQIAGEVGLRKRVVQVWFQNTRARERKGLYVKPSAGPLHQLPLKPLAKTGECENQQEEEQERPSLPESPFAVSDHIASLIPNSTSAFNLQNSMRKYYEDTMKRFMNDISDKQQQQGGSSNSEQQQQDQQPPVSSALDLTSNFDESSEFHDDSDPNNKSMETDSINGGGGNKRFRTQMSGVQVKMMKGVFEVYKTPTMTECSSLGQDIGLQKRVVQVWFQNARAKEKRAKLQLQQATGQEPEGPPAPEECKICGFRYSHKYAVQDHIFTRPHLDALRSAIESGRYDPESPGHNMAQTAAVIQAGGRPSTEAAAPQAPGLQMLQMATTAAAPPNNRELLDTMSSHQSNPRMLMQV